MADQFTPMDEDDDDLQKPSNNKGKGVVVSAAPPPDTRATTPWVEKFRPQSLDDVAAHRDIVETSECYFSLSYLLLFYVAFRRTLGDCLLLYAVCPIVLGL